MKRVNINIVLGLRCASDCSLLSRRGATNCPPHAVAMFALKLAAERELEKEMEVDELAGVKSIPPLVPAGWRMHHQPCTRYVLLKKLVGGQTSKLTSVSQARQKKRFNDRPDPSNVEAPFRGSTEARESAACSSLGIFQPASSIASVEVEIHIPFQTNDPSFSNSNIDLCEWQPFDVFVRKPGSGASAMLFRAAAVNSELRVRRIQFLSPSAATAVDILQRGEGVERTIGHTAADRAALAFGGQGLTSEYLRNIPYAGPSFTSLSNDLQVCVMDFLCVDIGIDALLLEYIQQAAYFAEHEEYQLWLVEMARFGKMRGGNSNT